MELKKLKLSFMSQSSISHLRVVFLLLLRPLEMGLTMSQLLGQETFLRLTNSLRASRANETRKIRNSKQTKNYVERNGLRLGWLGSVGSVWSMQCDVMK